MKTAMQQMLMFINSFDEEPINPIFLRLMAEQLIEKEKEQIVDAYEDGKENQRESITNIYKYIIGEYYYNQTYNK
jgi:hypothetical protein